SDISEAQLSCECVRASAKGDPDRCSPGLRGWSEIFFISDRLINTITEQKVNELSLESFEIKVVSPDKTLISLASHLRSLHIHERVANSNNYFFGLDNIDWAPIFLDMFARKLDKLYIQNHWNPEYLENDSVNSLK
ncbi:hypothetical protein PENTCL1PPCAC_21428, partial [Pristionchus entomophagus]